MCLHASLYMSANTYVYIYIYIYTCGSAQHNLSITHILHGNLRQACQKSSMHLCCSAP